MPFIGNKPSAVPLTSADITDGIITSAKIADGTIVNADINASAAIASTKLSGSFGITQADSWRLNANKSSNGDITANLERDDNTGFGYIGTGMTESSGIFTFPTTGIYLINFYALLNFNTDVIVVISIQTTTNNSTYAVAGESYTNAAASNTHTNASCFCFFDVTDVANCKVKFNLDSCPGNLLGYSTHNQTSMNFIRLGDT